MKKRFLMSLVSLLCLFATCLACVSCGKLKLVEKSELGLNFAIPEDFERTYGLFADIEYGNDETAFFADVMSYSELELSSGASVRECTEKILDNMKFGGVEIIYNDEKKTATFDTWATDETRTESYYNYITVLVGENAVFVARYVCSGDEKSMKKYSDDFIEMSAYLSVRQ